VYKIADLLEISVFHQKNFDFEDYDDTDISGMGMEITIDYTIYDVENLLRKEIPEDHILRDQARNEIKRLWIEKIKGWK
jgi:hypothetical protein